MLTVIQAEKEEREEAEKVKKAEIEAREAKRREVAMGGKAGVTRSKWKMSVISTEKICFAT